MTNTDVLDDLQQRINRIRRRPPTNTVWVVMKRTMSGKKTIDGIYESEEKAWQYVDACAPCSGCTRKPEKWDVA